MSLIDVLMKLSYLPRLKKKKKGCRRRYVFKFFPCKIFLLITSPHICKRKKQSGCTTKIFKTFPGASVWSLPHFLYIQRHLARNARGVRQSGKRSGPGGCALCSHANRPCAADDARVMPFWEHCFWASTLNFEQLSSWAGGRHLARVS